MASSSRHRAALVSQYLAIPMIGLATPFIAIPALTSAFGASGWASVAIGQSVGLAGATIVELGWALNGPQRVARAVGNRRQYFALALRTKAIVALPVGLLVAAAAAAVAPTRQVDAALAAFAFSLTGFSAAWYFIGLGRPTAILAAESLPRLAGIGIASLVMWFGGPLWSYAVIGVMVPAIVSVLAMMRIASVTFADVRQVRGAHWRGALRFQRVAMSGRLVSSVYISLPVTLVGIVSPGSVAQFSAAERLMRMGLTALSAIPAMFQTIVGRRTTLDSRVKFAGVAVVLNFLLGLLAAAAYFLFAPPVSEVLYSGVATVTPQLALLAAGVVLVVCISRATGGIALVARGKIHWITTSATAGALVGIPAVMLLGHEFGAEGGMLGALLAEVVVLCIQLVALTRPRRPRI